MRPIPGPSFFRGLAIGKHGRDLLTTLGFCNRGDADDQEETGGCGPCKQEVGAKPSQTWRPQSVQAAA